MKYIFIFAFIVLTTFYRLNAQYVNQDTKKLIKIVFSEHHDMDSAMFGNMYELSPGNDSFRLYRTELYYMNYSKLRVKDNTIRNSRERIFIKNIATSEVETLFSLINNDQNETFRFCRLGYTTRFGWKDAKHVAAKFISSNHLKRGRKHYLASMLCVEENINRVMPECIKAARLVRTSSFYIKFIFPGDTVLLTSDGLTPLMLPWVVDNHEIFNPGISTWLMSVIPGLEFSDQLNPDERILMEDLVVRYVYYNYCSPHYNALKLTRIFGQEFKRTGNDFEVCYLRAMGLSSIIPGAPAKAVCWNVVLQDKKEPYNLTYDLTLDNNRKKSGEDDLHLFLEQRDSLLNRIHKAKFLINHVKGQQKRSMKLYFVFNQSFSDQKREMFLEHLPDNMQHEGKYNLDGVLYLILTNERGTSSWLLFADGSIMLWYYYDLPPFINYPAVQQSARNDYFKYEYQFFDAGGRLLN